MKPLKAQEPLYPRAGSVEPPEIYPPPPPKPRSCNRHNDCDRADANRAAAPIWIQGVKITSADHCHDDCCEDCFGQ